MIRYTLKKKINLYSRQVLTNLVKKTLALSQIPATNKSFILDRYASTVARDQHYFRNLSVSLERKTDASFAGLLAANKFYGRRLLQCSGFFKQLAAYTQFTPRSAIADAQYKSCRPRSTGLFNTPLLFYKSFDLRNIRGRFFSSPALNPLAWVVFFLLAMLFTILLVLVACFFIAVATTWIFWVCGYDMSWTTWMPLILSQEYWEPGIFVAQKLLDLVEILPVIDLVPLICELFLQQFLIVLHFVMDGLDGDIQEFFGVFPTTFEKRLLLVYVLMLVVYLGYCILVIPLMRSFYLMVMLRFDPWAIFTRLFYSADFFRSVMSLDELEQNFGPNTKLTLKSSADCFDSSHLSHSDFRTLYNYRLSVGFGGLVGFIDFFPSYDSFYNYVGFQKSRIHFNNFSRYFIRFFYGLGLNRASFLNKTKDIRAGMRYRKDYFFSQTSTSRSGVLSSRLPSRVRFKLTFFKNILIQKVISLFLNVSSVGDNEVIYWREFLYYHRVDARFESLMTGDNAAIPLDSVTIGSGVDWYQRELSLAMLSRTIDTQLTRKARRPFKFGWQTLINNYTFWRIQPDLENKLDFVAEIPNKFGLPWFHEDDDFGLLTDLNGFSNNEQLDILGDDEPHDLIAVDDLEGDDEEEEELDFDDDPEEMLEVETDIEDELAFEGGFFENEVMGFDGAFGSYDEEEDEIWEDFQAGLRKLTPEEEVDAYRTEDEEEEDAGDRVARHVVDAYAQSNVIYGAGQEGDAYTKTVKNGFQKHAPQFDTSTQYLKTREWSTFYEDVSDFYWINSSDRMYKNFLEFPVERFFNPLFSSSKNKASVLPRMSRRGRFFALFAPFVFDFMVPSFKHLHIDISLSFIFGLVSIIFFLAQLFSIFLFQLNFFYAPPEIILFLVSFWMSLFFISGFILRGYFKNFSLTDHLAYFLFYKTPLTLNSFVFWFSLGWVLINVFFSDSTKNENFLSKNNSFTSNSYADRLTNFIAITRYYNWYDRFWFVNFKIRLNTLQPLEGPDSNFSKIFGVWSTYYRGSAVPQQPNFVISKFTYFDLFLNNSFLYGSNTCARAVSLHRLIIENRVDLNNYRKLAVLFFTPNVFALGDRTYELARFFDQLGVSGSSEFKYSPLHTKHIAYFAANKFDLLYRYQLRVQSKRALLEVKSDPVSLARMANSTLTPNKSSHDAALYYSVLDKRFFNFVYQRSELKTLDATSLQSWVDYRVQQSAVSGSGGTQISANPLNPLTRQPVSRKNILPSHSSDQSYSYFSARFFEGQSVFSVNPYINILRLIFADSYLSKTYKNRFSSNSWNTFFLAEKKLAFYDEAKLVKHYTNFFFKK